MRFTVRDGTDPVAGADPTLLTALGLPSGGIVRVGRTYVLVRPHLSPEPTALLLGPLTRENAGVDTAQSVDVTRAMLGPAQRVVVAGSELPAEPKHLVDALRGRPVTSGDRLRIDPAYLGSGRELYLRVVAVEPERAGLVGAATQVTTDPTDEAPARPLPSSAAATEMTPSTRQALLAGLDTELDVLTGWLTLLTSPKDLPSAWGLPRVAGVLLEGPYGCGKGELVAAASE
ncbi:MAG: hypothetical protein ACRDVM_07165, partial [Acidimicrobiia bacterium]